MIRDEMFWKIQKKKIKPNKNKEIKNIKQTFAKLNDS